MGSENGSASAKCATHCYSTVRLIAEHVVEQWETHDQYHMNADERPNDVIVAEGFLHLLDVADQVSVNGFESSAANGLLEAAVKLYKA